MTTNDVFERVLELVEHMSEELVDNGESLSIKGAWIDVTGVIQVTGPADEIKKVIGAQHATVSAIEVIVNAVAAKYGFKITLNVMSNERREQLEAASAKREV